MTTVSRDAQSTDHPIDVEALASTLTPGAVLTDPAGVAAYRFDFTADESAGMPLAVVRASSPADVQATVRWAGVHGIPLVPRGAGSGLSGGSNAIDGCVVLSLERMRAIEIDPATRTAVVEPGALNVEVKQAAARHGLWYPPDPSSFEICSIGGNVATNAGGLCCVKYGVTTDYVLGLDVVLADGTLVRLGGQRIKDAAGLSLVKLFVGSEGTLGVVTRATLRLVPAQEPPATLVATFDDVADAARVVVAIGARLRASMMELMDRASINAVEDHRPMGLDRGAGALLLAQSDAPGAGARRGDRPHGDAVLRGRCARVLHDDGAGRGRALRRRSPSCDLCHRAPRHHPARRRGRARAAPARAALGHRRDRPDPRRRDPGGGACR